MFTLSLWAFSLFWVASGAYLMIWKYFPTFLNKAQHEHKLRSIHALRKRHPTASLLSTLIDEDGAGSWPPRVDHHNWPAALRPYKEIYLQLLPLLSVESPSILDDSFNIEHRAKYRSLMRKLLTERINTSEVELILANVEAGQQSALPRDAYNGFYCCIAVCRHAYRWAMIPVVKVAQLEKIVDFPSELDVPWPYLQRRFGLEADSGNNTANVVLNFDSDGERVYKINVGMSDKIRSSEDVFFRVFYDLEVRALPLYHSMVMANIAFKSGDKKTCLRHLHDISTELRFILRTFYENLHETRISSSAWLSYIQGFQGWGVGHMIDGEYVKYDGLSGNHVLAFQALDAFLGIGQYLTDENMLRYIPRNQRELCYALRKHSIRRKLQEEDKADEEIERSMVQIVKQMRVFRAAHRTRVMPYLEQPAPERIPMTAGKSVLHGATIKEALSSVDAMMVKRFEETV